MRVLSLFLCLRSSCSWGRRSVRERKDTARHENLHKAKESQTANKSLTSLSLQEIEEGDANNNNKKMKDTNRPQTGYGRRDDGCPFHCHFLYPHVNDLADHHQPFLFISNTEREDLAVKLILCRRDKYNRHQRWKWWISCRTFCSKWGWQRVQKGKEEWEGDTKIDTTSRVRNDEKGIEIEKNCTNMNPVPKMKRGRERERERPQVIQKVCSHSSFDTRHASGRDLYAKHDAKLCRSIDDDADIEYGSERLQGPYFFPPSICFHLLIKLAVCVVFSLPSSQIRQLLSCSAVCLVERCTFVHLMPTTCLLSMNSFCNSRKKSEWKAGWKYSSSDREGERERRQRHWEGEKERFLRHQTYKGWLTNIFSLSIHCLYPSLVVLRSRRGEQFSLLYSSSSSSPSYASIHLSFFFCIIMINIRGWERLSISLSSSSSSSSFSLSSAASLSSHRLTWVTPDSMGSGGPFSSIREGKNEEGEIVIHIPHTFCSYKHTLSLSPFLHPYQRWWNSEMVKGEGDSSLFDAHDKKAKGTEHLKERNRIHRKKGRREGRKTRAWQTLYWKQHRETKRNKKRKREEEEREGEERPHQEINWRQEQQQQERQQKRETDLNQWQEGQEPLSCPLESHTYCFSQEEEGNNERERERGRGHESSSKGSTRHLLCYSYECVCACLPKRTVHGEEER